MRHRRCAMAVLILATSTVTAPGDDKPAAPAPKADAPAAKPHAPKPVPPPGSPKTVTVATAISLLRKEAVDGWKQNGEWPRTKSDFAIEKNWTIPGDAVAQALTRRLDNNPAIDAYIKWQLLSFTPHLDQADDKSIRQIVASLPRPIPQPSVSEELLAKPDPGEVAMSFGRQMAYVQNVTPVVGKGVVAYKPQMDVIGAGSGAGGSVGIQPKHEDPEITHRRRLDLVRQINADLESSRKNIAFANASVTAYRTSVAQWLPQTPSLKLVLLIKELHDRLDAGDDSCKDAFQRLLAEAKVSAGDPAIPGELRQSFMETCKLLGSMRTPVTDSVYLEGETIKPKGHLLSLAPNDVQILLGYFQVAPAQR